MRPALRGPLFSIQVLVVHRWVPMRGQLHPTLHDIDYIASIGAIPDECTRKQVFITSGHSQDVIRVLIEGLRPGSRHQFKLRAQNTRGCSPWTVESNVAKTSCMCELPSDTC